MSGATTGVLLIVIGFIGGYLQVPGAWLAITLGVLFLLDAP